MAAGKECPTCAAINAVNRSNLSWTSRYRIDASGHFTWTNDLGGTVHACCTCWADDVEDRP